MPQMDGIELCRRIRASGDTTPILMLTARETVSDRVAGLDAGADDYLVKPFALRELLARLRALLRRTADTTNGVLTHADLSLDPETREVFRGDRARSSSPAPSSCCSSCCCATRAACSTREVIFEQVWGYDMDWNSNSLEVYIGYLRRKTEAGGEPRLIRTVRGVGYVLREVA